MAGEPINQEQVNDFIVAEIEAITLETINRENLGKGIIESDLDMILCMKDKYRGEDAYDDEAQETIPVPGEDLTLEQKQDKVTDILNEILKIEESELLVLDRDILDFALQSQLNAEKAAKQKDLKAKFSKGFVSLILKDKVKEARKTLKESTAYKKAKDKLEEARKDRRNKSKEKKVQRICKTVEKVAEDCQKHIEDEDTMAELKTLLNKAFKVKPKKTTNAKKKKEEKVATDNTATSDSSAIEETNTSDTTVTDPTLEDVTPLINSDAEADEVVSGAEEAAGEAVEQLNNISIPQTEELDSPVEETATIAP